MRKNCLTRLFLIACLILLGSLIVKPTVSKAAPEKVVSIKNCDCSEFDISGDGNLDTIVATMNSDGDSGVVILNGEKEILHFDINEEYCTFDAKLISLENGTILLYIKDRVSEGVGTERIFLDKDGEFVEIGNLHPTKEYYSYGGDWYRVTDIKVSGNKIKVYGYFNCYSLGSMNIKFEYIVSDGKLKKSPSAGWIKKITQSKHGNPFSSKTMTTKRKLTAYKTATSSKKKMYIPKGRKVYVDRIYYSSKTGLRVRVKYHKKYGWVKLSKYGGKKLFKYIYCNE